MLRNMRLRTVVFSVVRFVDSAIFRRKALKPEEIRRVLFLKYETALGTAVNSTPIFEAIKRSRPDIHIAVACSGIAHGVLKHCPYIDELLPTENPHKSFWRTALQLWSRALKSGWTFDCALTDSGNQKARLAFLMLGLRATMRAGFMSDGIYHKTLAYDPAISVLQNNMRTLELLGIPPSEGTPKLFFSKQEAAVADRILSDIPLASRGPVIAFVTQTSGGQPSRWFDDRFAVVADRIAEMPNAQIVFVGTGAEAAAIDALRTQMKNPSVSIAGRTSIAELAAFLCKCDLVVTLDTGTMHIARAVGVPAVVVAAAWQPAHEWLPLDVAQIEIVRRNDIACRECRKFYCATHECMDEISSETVIASIDKWLKRHPPALSERQRRTTESLTSKSPSVE